MGINSSWLNQVERLTTAERDLATDGELTHIYNITKGVYEFYNGSEWVVMTQSGLDSEPTGSDQVFNIVSLTQAEYDAGTPNNTTFYIITDA